MHQESPTQHFHSWTSGAATVGVVGVRTPQKFRLWVFGTPTILVYPCDLYNWLLNCTKHVKRLIHNVMHFSFL